MLRVNGDIGFTLNFEIEVNMTEYEWMALTETQQMEYVIGQIDRHDYNNMEADGLDVWDIEEVEDEEV